MVNKASSSGESWNSGKDGGGRSFWWRLWIVLFVPCSSVGHPSPNCLCFASSSPQAPGPMACPYRMLLPSLSILHLLTREWVFCHLRYVSAWAGWPSRGCWGWPLPPPNTEHLELYFLFSYFIILSLALSQSGLSAHYFPFYLSFLPCPLSFLSPSARVFLSLLLMSSPRPFLFSLFFPPSFPLPLLPFHLPCLTPHPLCVFLSAFAFPLPNFFSSCLLHKISLKTLKLVMMELEVTF